MEIKKFTNTFPIYGITISSKGEDCDGHVIFWLGKFGYTIEDLNLIPPFRYKWYYKDKVYDKIAERKYGITYHTNEKFLHLNFGPNKDFIIDNNVKKSIGKTSKVIFLEDSKLIKKRYYNLKGKFVREMSIKDCFSTYTYTITIKDKYDDKIIKGKGTVEEYTWEKWNQIFGIKFNKRKIVRHSIEIEFEDVVGQEKDTWKGGILGAGKNIEGPLNEFYIKQTIDEFCKEHNLELIELKDI